MRCWITRDPTFGDQPLLPLQQTRWQACEEALLFLPVSPSTRWQGSTLDFSGEARGRVSDELMPKLRNCRIFYGNESLSHSNIPQIMRLNIPSLATQSQRAFGEFLSKGFRFFALFQSTGVCLWSPDHTSKHVAGVLATEAGYLASSSSLWRKATAPSPL